MENVSSPGPDLVPPGGKKPTGIAMLFQIAALVFGSAALIWGVFIVWSTAFPGPCGDSSGFAALGVAECWVVNVPIGLLTLAIGLIVKKGSPLLRRLCIALSLVTLSLPIIASVIWHYSHCH
jgi:hypothetical protein